MEMISDERLKELIKFTASMMFVKLYDGQAERYPYPEYKLALSELLDARRKIDMLKEDAERLASAIQHKGSFNEIMAQNFEAVMKHERVMKELDDADLPTLSSFIGCMKEVK
jgi:hypothetical protein